jgi:hypothetical protein
LGIQAVESQAQRKQHNEQEQYRRNERQTIFQNSRFLLDLVAVIITYNAPVSKLREECLAGTTKVLALDRQDLGASDMLSSQTARQIKQLAAWLD